MFADGRGSEPVLVVAMSEASSDHLPHEGTATVPRYDQQAASGEIINMLCGYLNVHIRSVI